MKKVCLVTPLYPKNGGISRWSEIIMNTSFKNCSVEILDSSVEKKRLKNGAKISHYIKSYFALIRLKNRLSKLMKQNNYAAIHVCTSGGIGFKRDIELAKIAKKHKVKTVLHLHFGRIPEILINRKGKEFLLFKQAVSLFDKIISIDEKTHNALLMNGIKSSFIENPVVVEKNKYNISSKQIIFVGLLSVNKGIRELLAAFDSLTKKYSEWTLLLIGPVSNSYKIGSLPTNCYYCGELRHDLVIENIKNSSFLVLPSYSEGMPNVVLEAMSCSVPVVATNVGDIKNMIRNCGILIEPKSIDQLVSAFEKMMSDESLRNLFSKNVEKKIKEIYNIDNIKSLLEKVWLYD